MTDVIPRPELTLPAAEAALLSHAYKGAEVILEYGSGGSTVMASELPGKRVFSVESAQDWTEMMKGYLAANPPVVGTQVEMIWVDIGPTKEWGHPVDDAHWRAYPKYALDVWRRRDFVQPDVVLVDGRFRQACALATAFLSTKPVDLFFDDYAGRKHYHKVEDYLGPPQITGRMAHFRVTPMAIPPEKLFQVVKFLQNP
ncbi:hypothetical protein [uncultured Pelagimonas sp.]|uniref:hypothetical protein n=1 Tax=uncultured Pelagimonas sp. TaxID=1618102 RepID=UPI0026137D01|nr:hypothetical protein [uncultured Pelagimonas sp.]